MFNKYLIDNLYSSLMAHLRQADLMFLAATSSMGRILRDQVLLFIELITRLIDNAFLRRENISIF